MNETDTLIAEARRVLLDERGMLSTDRLAALAALPRAATGALCDLAHEVRIARCGDTVEIEGIISAKTGGCPEDCHFCSQSASFPSDVLATPMLERDEVIRAAKETAELGATEFCIVLALRGPDERTMDKIMELTDAVRTEVGINVAVSAGMLSREQARRFADGGVHRYNHNLETARSFFGEIVSTHTWEERWETCELVKEHGMELCCGVLLGMGETDAQRIELIGQLQEIGPEEVPVNFLNPRPGTPLEIRPVTPADDALRWVALFRLGLPEVILRYAGGREITLGDLQESGMTSGINALIVGNYLTTLGRTPDEDIEMLDRLGMPIGALSSVF